MKLNFSFENFSFKTVFTSQKLISPRRDWIILLACAALALGAALTFDAFMYTQITSGEMYVSVNKDQLDLQPLKTDQLKAILDNFQNRSVASTSLKVGTQIDPSL